MVEIDNLSDEEVKELYAIIYTPLQYLPQISVYKYILIINTIDKKENVEYLKHRYKNVIRKEKIINLL